VLKIDSTERYNMKTKEALKLVGGLAKPSKMPGWAYGTPAKECKTGTKLRDIEGSTCEVLCNERLLCLSSGSGSSIQTPGQHQAPAMGEGYGSSDQF
jgi:hypothetical protein